MAVRPTESVQIRTRNIRGGRRVHTGRSTQGGKSTNEGTFITIHLGSGPPPPSESSTGVGALGAQASVVSPLLAIAGSLLFFVFLHRFHSSHCLSPSSSAPPPFPSYCIYISQSGKLFSGLELQLFPQIFSLIECSLSSPTVGMACATAPALHSSASWTASTVPSLRGRVWWLQ